MSKLEDKHFEHVAKMQSLSDYSWHSWNSPIGLSVFFLTVAVIAAIFIQLGIEIFK